MTIESERPDSEPERLAIAAKLAETIPGVAVAAEWAATG